MLPARWNRPERSPPNRRGFPNISKSRRFSAAFSLLGEPNCLIYVALQYTQCCYANKWIVAGIWYAYIGTRSKRSLELQAKKVTTMSDTASAPFAPSSAVLGRLIAAIDRLLMSGARIAARNGDLPYFGL
jgi:hypothetical protein